MERLRARWLSLPLVIRKFIVDLVETSAGAVIGVGFTLPASIDEATRQGVIVGTAVAAAALAVIRRHAPGWIAWLRLAFPATSLR